MKKTILLLPLIASLLTYAQPKLVGTVHFSGPKYGGSIFRIDLPGSTPGIVYSFNNAVPHRPTGGVIAGNDDWLYGSLNYNGVNNNGGFYRIQRNGSNFSMLFNNANSASGIPYYHTDEFLYVMGGNQLKRYDPVGNTVSNLADNVSARNLHIDTDDWIYFERVSSLSKIQTDGTSETFLYNFAFPGDGYDPIGVTEVSGNRLFGLHRLGGVSDGGTLYGIEKDGTGFAVHHIFTNATGVNPLSKLVYMDGKLFGTTNGGGAFGYGTLYSIDADGDNFRVLYHFNGGVSGNISISSNGRIFGNFSTSIWDALTFSYNKMYKIDTSGQNFESFFAINQREGGDFNQDILLLNDEDIYATTSEYGIHDGGTFNHCDTTGAGNGLYHFGLSATGFRPTGGVVKASDGKLYGATVFGGTDGNGIVFSVNADGTNYAVLHQFINSEGYEPSGKLLEASDGRLYGACRWGLSNSGILYRINKNGTGFEVIFVFTGSTDGYSPVGSLVEDAAGVLYGTCFYSSAVAGSVFKINKNGTGYSTLRLFSGSGGELGYPYNGLTLSKGYLYGACGYGGSESKGGLFRIRTNGSGYQVLHEFTTADGSGSLPVGTPYIANNGKIYGTVSFGGPTDEGAVYRIDSVGTNFVVLHQFSGFTQGSYPWGGMIQASDGLMYGSTQTGGSGGGGTIFKLNLDGSGFTVIKNINIETDGQGISSTIIDLNGNFALPVQWVKFTATKKEQSTLLSWQTAAEQTSDRFEIERSANGTVFNSIGTVASTNNPNGAQYSFQDNNPLTGINYYRLKQLDIDGKFEYSRVVQLRFDYKGSITIYPNPVKEWLTISVTGSQAIRSIVITDLTGKVVQKNQNLLTSTIPVHQLKAGAYMIRVETSQAVLVGKFVKQ